MESVDLIFRFIIVLPIIIFLLILTLRFLNNKSISLAKANYLNVIEKIQLTKECTLAIIKTGEDALVVAITSGGVETLRRLSKDELQTILDNKEEHRKELVESYQKYLDKIKYRGKK
jgi:flagellar protein FliO/FliZ